MGGSGGVQAAPDERGRSVCDAFHTGWVLCIKISMFARSSAEKSNALGEHLVSNTVRTSWEVSDGRRECWFAIFLAKLISVYVSRLLHLLTHGGNIQSLLMIIICRLFRLQCFSYGEFILANKHVRGNSSILQTDLGYLLELVNEYSNYEYN